MLQKLTVENIAIIQSVELELKHGLSILTGETGAGKSIIIDALGLALGARADSGLVRNGADKALVEAYFDRLNPGAELKQVLESAGLEYKGGDIVIRREIRSNGKSRAFFNDELIPLSALKALGSGLVEMHGQHENQKLFKPKNHLLFLGKCVEDRQVIENYRRAYHSFKQHLRAYQELLQHRDNYLRERELREFHFKELDQIKPEPGELENMQQELKLLENSGKLATAADHLAKALYENEDAAIHQIEILKKTMQEILQADDSTKEIAGELQSALISLTEVGRSMAEYRDNMEHNPEKLALLQERTGAINYQMRKHKRSFDELCEYYAILKEEMRSEADYEMRLEALSRTLEEARGILAAKAADFHKTLENTAAGLAEKVESRLHLLGMKNARFRIELIQKETSGPSGIPFRDKTVEPTVNGIDEAEFLIITNPGESFKPLIKIASGGEISRIMLAIKAVLAEHDETPTLIFDEIDAGVSGRVAHVVGEQIRELAKHHQILCITHLPQIASMGDQHYRVDKYSKGNETFARTAELDPSERVQEIAALVGGKHPSDASLKTAEELLNNA